MPSSIRFPGALDNDSSLYLVVNNKRTRLTTGITDTDTTIPVITTSGFPTVGFISILTGADITKTEAIAYSGTGATTFLNAERGADGTVALPHNPNDNVDLTIVSRHHNNLKDAVIELERYVGVSGSERFVPFQFPGGNVILPGTLSVQNTLTVSGGATFAFVTVTGTLSVGGDFDFKADGAISGTLTVGEIPVATGTPTIQFDLEDGTFSTSSTTYVDITGSQTGPLPVGNCLLLYSASAGSTVSSPPINLKCVFAGVDVGEAEGPGYLTGDPFGAVNLGGFKIVTGDGVNTAKLQIDLDAGSSTGVVSACGLLAIPLQAMGLVLNQDYWFSNGSESTVNITSATFSDVTTVVATLPATGDYLVFGSAEMTNNVANPINVRYQVDSTTISTTYEYDFSTVSDFKTFPFARLINVTGGPHTFRVQAARDTSGTATIKRARLCIIRADAFSKISGLRSGTDAVTSSSTYAKVTPSEITFTPNQRETIVVIANPDATVSTATGPPTPCYKLVNETSGSEYMIDSSPAKYIVATSDILPTLMFTKIDNVATPQTFSLSFRDGEATGSTITHTNVNMVVWSMTTTVTSDEIQYTVIDGDGVRAHNIEADNLEVSTTATVSGIPVMINVPEPLFATSIVTNQVTVTGSAIIKDLTVTGTARFEGDEVGISGVLAVEGDATFCSAIDVGCEADVLFAFQDTEQSTQSTSFIAANCETGVLRRDVEYLVMYCGVAGGQFAASNLASPRLRLVHGSDEIALCGDGTSSPNATFANNGVALGGFTVVTGTGAATLKFEFRDLDGSDVTVVDAMSVVAIPLENLERGVDYFYDVRNSATYNVVNAPITFGAAANKALESTFIIPATGTYLYMGSVEAQNANDSLLRQMRARFLLNGNVISPEYRYSSTTAYQNEHLPNFQFLNTLSLGPGPQTFTVEVASSGAATSDFRRGRNILIRADAFDQLGKSSRTTVFSTSSSTFSNVIERTYTPNRNEKLLVIGHGVGSSNSGNTVALATLRDNTAGVNYREESGYTQVGVGLGTTDADNPPTLMLHLQDVNAGQTKAWRFMGRSRDGATTINWGRLAPSAAATDTNIFTWSMTNVARTYASTIITSSGIDTHKLRAEKVEVSESLTISGVPVSTGTITNAVFSLNDKTGNITITGTGGAVVTTSGQTIIIDAAGAGTGSGGQGCFTHTQSIAATTWNVAHDLGTEIVTYIVLDNTDTQIDPDSFTVVDENNVTIVFAAAQAGQVHIFPCGGSSVLNLNGCYTHVQSTASTSWVINHNLYSLPINYMVVDNSYVQVIPNSFAINSDTQATITFSAPQAGRAFMFPCVSGTGAGGSNTATLQTAYDQGDGAIVTISGKPVLISGALNDRAAEFKVIGSGIFTEALTVGEGTTYVNDHSITTGSGIFTHSLTVSGIPVAIGDSSVTLQEAYDNSSTGVLVISPNKPVIISGTVGGATTTTLTQHSITTTSGVFTYVTAISGSFSQGLTVSGLPVSLAGGGGGGGSADTLQDAYDNGDGRIVLTSGKPLMVISGAPGVDDVDFDVWGDVGISGTLEVRQDITGLESVNAGMVFVGPTTALGAGSLSNTLFAAQDNIVSTSSTSLVDTGCTTPPLSAGVEYAIFYSGLIGANQRSREVELVCTYGTTVIGRANHQTTDKGTTSSGSHLGGFCAGFYKLTGDGSNSIKFQHRALVGTTIVQTGPLSIVAMPLNDLAEGEDYFYIQQNGDSPTLENASENQFNPIISGSFNIPVTEDYLVLMSAEGSGDSGTLTRYMGKVRFLQNSTTLKSVENGPEFFDAASGEEYHSVTFARVITLNSGPQNLVIEGRSSDNAVATQNISDFRRGRIFAFRKSTFEQIIDTQTTTDKTITATSFGDVNSSFSQLDTTYTPNHSEKVILLSSLSTTYTNVSNTAALLALRDDTAGVNYRSDMGMHIKGATQGSANTSNENTPMLLHLAEFSTPKTWKILTRDPVGNSPHIGTQGSTASAIRSDFILWGLSLAASGTTIPVATTITATGIETRSADIHDLRVHADAEFDSDVVIEGGLTVSGQPVTIGDFVRRAGDTMTGNLNMNRRLVQNAGVVSVQNATPTATVTGLLWFDADAVGTYPSDPNLPVGGVFASTSVITSGTTVPDSTIVTVPWNVSLFDNGGWFSHTDSSRLTVPSGVTHVRLSAAARFDANATGRRQVLIYRNGSTAALVPASGIGNSAGRWGEAIVEPVSAASTDTIIQIETPILTVSGGDYFQVGVFHTSGGPLTVESGSAYFSALAVNTRGVPGVNSVNALKGDISVLPGAGISISSNSGSNIITVSGTTTLQTAYDNGNGVIVTTSGKPFVVSGTEDDGALDFKVVGSGFFSEGLRVGEGTVHINPSGIKAHAGEFVNLTASGLPVLNSQSLASPLKFVRRQTLTTATGVVTFNLPQTADYLHVQIKSRSDRTGAADELDTIFLRFNNDATAKYNTILHGFDAGGAGSNSSDGVNQTSGLCGLSVSNDTTAAAVGSTEIWIHDYRDTSTHTVWTHIGVAAGDTGTGDLNYRSGGGRYTVTSGISVISFSPSNGPNFMAGSKFVIYGYSDEEIG